MIFIDLYSKKYAEERLDSPKFIFNGIIELTYVRNYGVAFNRLSGKKTLIILMNLVMFGVLIYQIYFDSSGYLIYGLLLAGGLGNFINRVQKGYVIDFVYFNIKKWPVFNIADFQIIVGVILLLIREYWR